jgi:hypothetical protein
MSGRLLLRWDICCATATPFLKSFFIPGLYSGIFALHLQIHASRKEPDSRKQYIIFHALWVLYGLSAATIALDTTGFVIIVLVSDNERLLLMLISFAELWSRCCVPPFDCSECNIRFRWFHCAIYPCTHNYPFKYSSNFSKIQRCWIVWGRNIGGSDEIQMVDR